MELTFEKAVCLQRLLNVTQDTDDAETVRIFQNAWNVDPKVAMRIAFFLRDCRGGKGLRRQFFPILKFLARYHAEELIPYLKRIPFFGCWKDLWQLMETPVQQEMLDMYVAAIVLDKKRMEAGLPVSMAAKWFPSEGKSIDKEFNTMFWFSTTMNLAPFRIRRVFISPLRRYIDVSERKMSAGQWHTINYNKQSVANKKHRRAFWRHDRARFNHWRAAVTAHRPVFKKPTNEISEFLTLPRYKF